MLAAFVVSNLLAQIPTLIFTAVGLGLLIAIHEFGHLIVARWMGMRVEVYSIGFGKRLWGFSRGGIDYRISAFPLGGYCRIAGFSVEDPAAHDWDDQGSFVNKAAWRRFLVIAAGPGINWLTAVAIVLGLFVSVGMPDRASLKVAVLPGGPAEQAGMQTGDRILAVDGVAVHDLTQLVGALGQKEGVRTIEVERAGAHLPLQVTPKGGRIQVSSLPERGPPVSFAQALPASLSFVWTFTQQQVLALVDVFRARGGASLSGPVGIVQQAAVALKSSVADFVTMLALISVGLCIFNFLPIPALDGGRLVFLAYELVTRRRVNHTVEMVVNTVGALLLIALLLGVTLFGDLGLGAKVMKLLHR